MLNFISESAYEEQTVEEIYDLLKQKSLSNYALRISVVSEDIAKYQAKIEAHDDESRDPSGSHQSKRARLEEKLSLAIKQRDELIQLAIQEASVQSLSIDKESVSSHKVGEVDADTDMVIDDGDMVIADDSDIGQYHARQLTIDLQEFEKIDTISISTENQKLKSYATDTESTFQIPSAIWSRLFEYQQHGVEWLWRLYLEQSGGILADEMGLGKSVQLLVFLNSLYTTLPSSRYTNPILIVCPATLLQQWLSMSYKWCPTFRVVIFHHSNKSHTLSTSWFRSLCKSSSKVDILLTSYTTFQQYQKSFLNQSWLYVVLDEGHKIRNPQAGITIACKQLLSPNRLLLTATPIQNNLIELWSLMDFVCPGRLGTQSVFAVEFSVPIHMGGYAHAETNEIKLAHERAALLQSLVEPYMLRRWKRQVAIQLPEKIEQIVQCKLTNSQRAIYKNIISKVSPSEPSEEVEQEWLDKKDSRSNSFLLSVLDQLRKLCNHPWLLKSEKENYDKRSIISCSCKMEVVIKILDSLDRKTDKVLLFCQTRQMLDILEEVIEYINRERGLDYKYLRMDGTTEISLRPKLVQQFNSVSDGIFLFLLTTRVGGIGVNLTGANYVILYDPDWNPSTDLQARERAWRIGQERTVTILRLMTIGTIEEKIYHRQIFKQILTNRILQDPKHLARQFKPSDLYDLFSLEDDKEDIEDILLGQDSKDVESKDQEAFGILNMLLDLAKVRPVSMGDTAALAATSNPLELAAMAERLHKEADKIVSKSLDAYSNRKRIISQASRDLDTSDSLLDHLWSKKTQSSESSIPNSKESLSVPIHPIFNNILHFFHNSETLTRTTDELTKTFKNVQVSDVVLFKKCLKKIAQRKGHTWHLRSEFYPT
jgi:SNF2 family DNA or RNA helicase